MKTVDIGVDLVGAWCRYRGTRICCEAMRWVASWNRRTLTAEDGARIIERLRELAWLRAENDFLRAELERWQNGGGD